MARPTRGRELMIAEMSIWHCEEELCWENEDAVWYDQLVD
jgi:hypothetical protein